MPMNLWMFVLAVLPVETPQEILRARFEHRVQALSDGVDGVVGVTITDLKTDESFSVNGDIVFTLSTAPTAQDVDPAALLAQGNAARDAVEEAITGAVEPAGG